MKEVANSTGQTEQRRLAAIMFTDIVGFSRQMGTDEARMLRLLEVHNQIVQQAVSVHHGHVIKTIGDAFLVDFPSVVHAVQCARTIQVQLQTHNTEQEKAEQIHVRIGIHSGDIVQRDGDVFGDGVNIASRLQSLAEPDTICISDMVYRDVVKKLDLDTVVPLGKPKLKNIAERFPVYALLPQAPTGVRQTLQVQRLKLSRRFNPAHRAIAGGVLLAGAILLVWYFAFPTPNTQPLTPSTQPPPLPDKPSIVVLPFDNMSKDPEQDYFSNGITEVLTSDLSRISSLFVITRNTAFTYKGKAVNVQEVGKELGVRYVVEGSVQKAGDQVRIVAQLIDTTTGSHIWSERYDRPLTDIFAVQDEVVRNIVTTLKLQLTLQEQGYLVRKHTDNLEAYDLLLRGVEPFFRFTQETNAQARQLWEKALALDPQYAEAYAWLGWTYWREWGFRWSMDPQTLEHAFALAQRAVALDDSLSRAHSVLSFVYASKQLYDQAIAEGEQATALDPNNADCYTARAFVFSVAGRPEDALRMMEQAMRLNPHYPPIYLFQLGWAYSSAGQYTEAVATLKELISRSPNFLTAHLVLARTYVQQWSFQLSTDPQMLVQAVAAARRALALDASYYWSHIVLGQVYLSQQQYDQALAEMKQGVALAPTEAGTHAALAEGLSCMGRTEEALEAAAQALRLKGESAHGHLASVGTAYAVAERYEEAIGPLKQYLSHYPNILGAHLDLAAVYSELGKETEAQAEAAEVLRINPHWSLEVWKERVPYKEPVMLERVFAALRKAGLR
jgi:adenylate cyclase